MDSYDGEAPNISGNGNYNFADYGKMIEEILITRYNVSYRKRNKRLRSRHLFRPDKITINAKRLEFGSGTSGCEADICSDPMYWRVERGIKYE